MYSYPLQYLRFLCSTYVGLDVNIVNISVARLRFHGANPQVNVPLDSIRIHALGFLILTPSMHVVHYEIDFPEGGLFFYKVVQAEEFIRYL